MTATVLSFPARSRKPRPSPAIPARVSTLRERRAVRHFAPRLGKAAAVELGRALEAGGSQLDLVRLVMHRGYSLTQARSALKACGYLQRIVERCAWARCRQVITPDHEVERDPGSPGTVWCCAQHLIRDAQDQARLRQKLRKSEETVP